MLKGGDTKPAASRGFGGLFQASSPDKSPNRNYELEALKVRYEGMCQQFKSLHTALKQRHEALLQTAKSRVAVSEAFTAMTEESPLSYSTKTSDKAMEVYSKKAMDDRANEYSSGVLDYFTQWQTTVTTRINSDIKMTEQLQRDADHYTTKVNNLKTGIQKLEDSQKPVPADKAEKLERNEQKYNEALGAYNRSAKNLVMLLEELVDRSWRDLHPLLLKMIQFDLDNHEDEQDTLMNDLQRAVDDLKHLQEDNNIPDEHRLKDLEKAKPQDLATEPAKTREREPQPYSSNDPQRDNKDGDKNRERSPKKDKKKKKKKKGKDDDEPSMPNAPPPVYRENDDDDDQDKDSPSNPWSRNKNDNNDKNAHEDSSLPSRNNNNDDKPKSKLDREPQPYGMPSSTPDSPDSSGRDKDENDDEDFQARAMPSTNNNDREAQPYSSNPSKDYDDSSITTDEGDGEQDFAKNADKDEDDFGHKMPPQATKTLDDSDDDDDDDDDDKSNNEDNSNRSENENKNFNIDGDGNGNNNNNSFNSNPSNNNDEDFPSNDQDEYNENRNTENGRMPWRPPRASGKGTKRSASAPAEKPTEEDAYANADPDKWNVSKETFSGGFVYTTLGETEERIGSIKKGKKEFKANPAKYCVMVYQTDMLDWPVEHQRYNYVHRKGTKGYVPTGVSKGGHMTVLTQFYERLPPMPDNDLPLQFRDEYTDHMTHQEQKLHSENNKPILPGRGMGVGDTPDLKVIGDVDPSDIHQGSVGNCWLLSGISAMAEFDGAITHLFRKTTRLEERPLPEPNQYIITLWDLETWTERDIVVDERLAVKADGSGQLLGTTPSEDGELWVCYLEKALAVHCGGWDKITGGQCTHAWALMTGCKDQYTIRINEATGLFACYGKYDPNTKKHAKMANSPHDGDKNMWPNPWPEVGGGGGFDKELTQEELFMKMCAWDDMNFIIGAACTGKSGDSGLVDNHAYSVLECHNDVAGTDVDLIKVRNPWGKGEIEDGKFDDNGPGWKQYPQIKAALNPVAGDDGIFWVTKQEFFEFFSTIYLSASNMTKYFED